MQGAGRADLNCRPLAGWTWAHPLRFCAGWGARGRQSPRRLGAASSMDWREKMVGTGRFDLPIGSATPRSPRRLDMARIRFASARVGALAVGSHQGDWCRQQHGLEGENGRDGQI
jgi:hypothetical protein